MPLDLLTTRGSDPMADRRGLSSLGEAIAELMARYDFVVDGQAAEDASAEEAELAFATCD